MEVTKALAKKTKKQNHLEGGMNGAGTGETPTASLLRGCPVIPLLCDVSTTLQTFMSLRVMTAVTWVCMTGEGLGKRLPEGLHVRVPVVGESQRF